jgi:hypothetical protein
MSQDNSRQGITTNVNKLSITKTTNRQLQNIASIIEATGQVRPTTNAIVGALVSEAWHTKRWPLIRTVLRPEGYKETLNGR